MPEQLVINKFDAGWCPSDDAINGRKNALLRMNNVELDQNGALKLSGGCKVVRSGYPYEAHTLYSRIINLTRKDYAALTNGSVYRDGTSIISGGDTLNAGFGTAFDYTLICSGNQRKKDSGTGTPINLGIGIPTDPVEIETEQCGKTGVVPLTTATVLAAGNADIMEDVGVTFINYYPDSGEQVTILQSYGIAGVPFNWNTFSDGGDATDDDYLLISFTADTEAKSPSVKLDILLVAPDSIGSMVTDYYTVTLTNSALGKLWNNDILKIKRSDFTRVGTGAQDWSTVYGFRLTLSDPSYAGMVGWTTFWPQFVMGDDTTPMGICFRGGSNARTGTYDYVQMNVNNTGSYLAKSELGPKKTITLDTVRTKITVQDPVAVDNQVNEVWIFRRGGIPDNTSYYATIGKLDQYYRVAVLGPTEWGTPWVDNITDEDALELNITADVKLLSIASTSITEKIITILGPISSRWYYFTEKFMYPSDIDNPDLVNVLSGVRITGDSSEIFLWACIVNESVVLVGTSCDIYILTGTFSTLPDNTVDIYYRPLGVAYPPITNDAVSYGSLVFYLANDGWRTIDYSGNNNLIIAPNIDRLYRGEECYDYDPVNLKIPPGSKRFPLTVGMNKLWACVYGINHIQVYDFIRQYWRVIDYNIGNITASFATQDGKILVFCGTDLKLREIDSQETTFVDETTQQSVSLLFPVHDGGVPLRRKDNYTLKIRCYTGASATTLDIKIIDEEGTEYTIADNISSPTAVVELVYNLEAILDICKTWQLKIEGEVDNLIIEDVSIDYDLRPPQLTFLRILPTNFGTPSRKRVYEIPFQVDTLGYTSRMLVDIDGYVQEPLVFSTSRKQTLAYKQPAVSGDSSDILKGVDYGFEISADTGVFEWFGFTDKVKMEVLPEPIYAYLIPPTNFGNACKKRLRVWPFVLDCCGGTVTFLPIVDGLPVPSLAVNYTGAKQTWRHYYTQDVFGVDYSGMFYSTTAFELYEVMSPDIVQILPLARRYDQLGPEDLFRHGRIKQFEYRVMPIGGTTIPYIIYFNDNSTYSGEITAIDEKEASYYIGVPKTTGGNIVRVVFGPTAFDFHRFYVRLQVFRTGKDTELEWVSLES